MTMRWQLQDMDVCELPLTGGDEQRLQWFFLLGWVDNGPAAAEWDGHRLRISRALFEVASLAERVDRIFAESGQSDPNDGASLIDSPGRALLTLARVCDGIYVLETTDENGRRSW
jgi:hypothetical protein